MISPSEMLYYYILFHYLSVPFYMYVLMTGGVVPQESLDALVRGRDAQRHARKQLGKTRVASNEMV